MQNSQSGQVNVNGFEEPKEDQPWYVKYGIRALGTAAGGLGLLLGALSVIFSILSPTCIIFGIWQMLISFAVVVIESPCCCVFLDHVQTITNLVESKPLWMKAAAYFVAPLPSIIICPGVYTIIGGGLILATGVVYGMIALGKKASREEMVRNAQVQGPTNTPYSAPPPATSYPPTTTKSPPTGGYQKKDPLQEAATQWASQSSTAPTYPAQQQQNAGPPPSYAQSQAAAPGWDQSFLSNSTQNVSKEKGPYDNPFQ